VKDLITELLPSTSPEGLLKAYASLTHQMHGLHTVDSADLREQRDLVEAELLRRMRPAPQPDPLAAMRRDRPVLPPRRIVDAPQA